MLLYSQPSCTSSTPHDWARQGQRYSLGLKCQRHLGFLTRSGGPGLVPQSPPQRAGEGSLDRLGPWHQSTLSCFSLELWNSKAWRSPLGSRQRKESSRSASGLGKKSSHTTEPGLLGPHSGDGGRSNYYRAHLRSLTCGCEPSERKVWEWSAVGEKTRLGVQVNCSLSLVPDNTPNNHWSASYSPAMNLIPRRHSEVEKLGQNKVRKTWASILSPLMSCVTVTITLSASVSLSVTGKLFCKTILWIKRNDWTYSRHFSKY